MQNAKRVGAKRPDPLNKALRRIGFLAKRDLGDS